MALALEKALVPSAVYLGPAQLQAETHKLNICVVFTSAQSTLRALRQAAALAESLPARITLVVAQIVPYPAPLESPPVLLNFNERRFWTVANESHIETAVRIYLCRDRWEMLASTLQPRSLVVLGGRKRWWPTAEERLAKGLRHLGHEVVFVETE